MDDLKRIEQIINGYIKKKIQIAIAESCTGGYISHMITNISGASKVFERGIISYSNDAKIDVLKVDPESIEEKGAVSEIVAKQMAINIRKLSNVDIGIGITGIAGPTGSAPGKPVGLVFISFSNEKETIVEKYIFKSDRINFKKKVLEKILLYLEKY